MPKEVIRRLQNVHGMRLTPMLVTVFVAGADFRNRDVMPNITEIFKKYTELMLGRWDDKKGLEQQYQSTFKDLLLQRIAFAMHSRRVSAVPLEEFSIVLRKEIEKRPFPEDSEDVTEELLYRSNLLSVEDGLVSFRHPLIREFFAGRAIHDPKELEKYVVDEWWRRAIVFYFGEHPDHHSELMALADASTKLSLSSLFDAAVTIGLAAQACHFAETSERLESLDWVVKALSFSMEPYLNLEDGSALPPLTKFLMCYMLGRDAVGASLIKDVSKRFVPHTRPQEFPDEIDAAEQFWCIVGLIEAGEVAAAMEALKVFNPKDDRLLLGIDLGCFFVSQLKVSTKEEKQDAEDIRKYLAPKIPHLRYEVLQEFKSQLLELRDGRITALAPRDDSGASEKSLKENI
ncbi:MAG: hypothetical protein EOP04_25465 [Proteobacteria bacterium]|nr:MAG: hypothetical protein EOP04_25465 [Pseudomonadota bacterium]